MTDGLGAGFAAAVCARTAVLRGVAATAGVRAASSRRVGPAFDAATTGGTATLAERTSADGAAAGRVAVGVVGVVGAAAAATAGAAGA
ncbi:hypothetical protein, partial [Burkholderia sp. Tr-20390]|uniref:hypothetical protein n=1 Tax=Burkholderia sp. Tr-20390 TaxID=2703904 RepID=UPI00197E18B4